ncbi:MAG: hypothetical protein ACR2K2_10095 [Mycobacteriales bacterium]
MSAHAEARDWADTGDPDFEPDLVGDSAGATRDRPAGRLHPARMSAALAEDETVLFTRPDFDEPAAAPAPKMRRTGPPRRPAMLVQGLWPALLAGGLALSASFGVLPLAAAILAVQVFLILGALALLDAPAAGGAFLVATAAAVAADAVVLLDDGSISGLAGVAGVGLVGSLAHQLARRGRNRVTESLADTLVVLVVAVAAACLLALPALDGGETVLQVSFASAGAVLLAGRVGDCLSPRPMLAVGSTRGWLGLLLGLAAGVAAAGLVAGLAGEPTMPAALLVGLVVASTVATADLAVDLGAAELRSGWRDARRVAALRPTALLLPYAVLGPVALLAGRLVLS